MMQKSIFLLLIAFGTCTLISCKDKKVYKFRYYSSGKLKSKGWYINDTIPVDTFYSFFENGKVLSISERDDSGFYTGVNRYFFDNGKLEQVDSFRNKKVNGFSYRYYPNGHLRDKIYFWDGKRVGDCYCYNEIDNVLNRYCFFDFEGHNRNLITYDSLGKLKKHLVLVVFVDSISTYSDSLNKENYGSYDIKLVISNPPECRSIVMINYFSNAILVHTDTIVNEQIYFSRKKYTDRITKIKYNASQYDSIKKKYLYQTGEVNVEN